MKTSAYSLYNKRREKSMSWNGMERNKLDYIITDLLPVELSELFSYTSFYSFLLEEEQQKCIEMCMEKIQEKKAKGNSPILKDGWATKPMKYRILKGSNSMREMSILQPLSALNVFFFMECYQKDILDYFEQHHRFSIRYHKKRTDLYYKGKTNRALAYYQKQISQLNRGVIQQTGIYFKIFPFESINSFTDSYAWRTSNFRFKYYAKIDYKSCFDSIYTHAFSWIIERNVVDAKHAFNSQLYVSIDRVMQNINGRSSNGIVVGPEFSRLIAEVMLQNIDEEVYSYLASNHLLQGVDYEIFRYVDDVFLFANEQNVITTIIEAFKITAEKYLLHLNDLKMEQDYTPCVPKEWLEKTRALTDNISGLFKQIKKSAYYDLPPEEQYIVKTDYVHIDRLKDEIAILIKKHDNEKRSIVSFLLSTLVNHISKVKDGFTLFKRSSQGKSMLLIDLALYIYAFYPSYDQTRKVISIISHMNREVDFKNIESMRIKLSRCINRYSFVFQFGNLCDICDWFPFLREYKISLDVRIENDVISNAKKISNPIIWGNILFYSQYYTPFFTEVQKMVEEIVEKKIEQLTDMEMLMQDEFWYVLIYHNCPFLSNGLLNKIDDIIQTLYRKSSNGTEASKQIETMIYKYLLRRSSSGKKPEVSFFNWKGLNNFGDQIAYRTYQRTLFKRYGINRYNYHLSID